jgi:hypothetical protein
MYFSCLIVDEMCLVSNRLQVDNELVLLTCFSLTTFALLPTGGAPLGYVDWNIIGQGLVNGAESTAIFGATAAAVDQAMSKGFLSRFPG